MEKKKGLWPSQILPQIITESGGGRGGTAKPRPAPTWAPPSSLWQLQPNAARRHRCPSAPRSPTGPYSQACWKDKIIEVVQLERTCIKGGLETAASFPQHPPESWRAAAGGVGMMRECWSPQERAKCHCKRESVQSLRPVGLLRGGMGLFQLCKSIWFYWILRYIKESLISSNPGIMWTFFKKTTF